MEAYFETLVVLDSLLSPPPCCCVFALQEYLWDAWSYFFIRKGKENKPPYDDAMKLGRKILNSTLSTTESLQQYDEGSWKH